MHRHAFLRDRLGRVRKIQERPAKYLESLAKFQNASPRQSRALLQKMCNVLVPIMQEFANRRSKNWLGRSPKCQDSPRMTAEIRSLDIYKPFALWPSSCSNVTLRGRV